MSKQYSQQEDNTSLDESVKNKPVERSAEKTEELSKRQIFAERRVRIKIPSGRAPHERSPVQVGVNGTAFLIKRDIDVDVPQSVVDVLENAKEQVPTTIEEGGRKRVEFKASLRFPYQIMGYINPKTGALEAV